ncbi:Hypothetical protein A7982_01037 [Minicystis rosea]|nr:Hypothetical protein A7982_01037 [Minicystis rosea]
MMNRPSKRLPELVPALYRAKDANLPGKPLAALLRALGTELDALDDVIHALLDDHFVERASEEALRRLAELVGARLFGSDPRVTRAVVARSVAWRRRKGTATTLEDIITTTTGWGVDVDEGFRSLAITQDLRHPLATRGRTADLRDPIVLADPLSESARTDVAEALALRDGEGVDDALRRIGRADAGRHAASPRTVDLRGWARPDAVAVRTTRLVAVPHEGVSPGPLALPLTETPSWIFSLDPLGRATPLLWDAPLEGPERIGTLTAAHEPDLAPPAPPRTATTLLTPTALAAAPEAVLASNALGISVDGIPLLGPDPVPEPAVPIHVTAIWPAPLLRFVDATRPAPGDTWQLNLVARPDDPNDDDLVLVSSDGDNITHVTPLPVPPSSSLVLAVKRLTSTARCRTTTGWIAVNATDLLHAGPAMAITVGGTPYAVRLGIATEPGPLVLQLINLTTRLEVGRFEIDSVALTDPTQLHSAAKGNTIVILRPSPGGSIALRKVVITMSGGTPTLAVSDIATLPYASSLSPSWRMWPAALLLDDAIAFYGGLSTSANSNAVLDDVWTVSIDGGAWTRFNWRNPQPRFGAQILEWKDGGVLIGGHSSPPSESASGTRRVGPLDPTVWFIVGDAPRPTWRQLPSLPIEPGRPGQVIARVTTADEIEALVWADRTRPMLFTLDADGRAWSPRDIDDAALEDGAPNPPADGAGAFIGDEVLVFGAQPLPPSEVLFSLAGRRRLAFLPELDLRLISGLDEMKLAILGDGSTAHPSIPRGPLSGELVRAADGFGIGVPGRIDRHRFTLRQRILGPEIEPHLEEPPSPGIFGLDPRIGRVVLPRVMPPGTLTVSYRAGRGSAIGAGCMPRDRAPLPAWLAPGEVAPTPPDLAQPAAPLTAWVDPQSHGLTVRRRGVDIPAFGTLEQALAASSSTPHAALGIIGSPRLTAASLTPNVAGFSIVAEPNTVPLIDVSPAPTPLSLVVLPRPGAAGRAEMWLAGLWLAGPAYVMLTQGLVDLRWCTLSPGGPALILAGTELPDVPRRSAQSIDVELRLYGCIVGGVEIPPWVRLVAAGCTFDAGGSALAINAPGSPVRLRHCTVRGGIEAGELQASSCAFDGTVRASRPDEGFIRHSLLRRGPSQPRLYRSLDRAPAFVSVDPASPSYLVLADNDGPAITAGELGRMPGAHDQRSDRARELVERTRLSMPMTLVACHVDRAVNDLARMNRSSQ